MAPPEKEKKQSKRLKQKGGEIVNQFWETKEWDKLTKGGNFDEDSM